mgnify:CR=1 FL=1
MLFRSVGIGELGHPLGHQHLLEAGEIDLAVDLLQDRRRRELVDAAQVALAALRHPLDGPAKLLDGLEQQESNRGQDVGERTV